MHKRGASATDNKDSKNPREHDAFNDLKLTRQLKLHKTKSVLYIPNSIPVYEGRGTEEDSLDDAS